MALQTKMGDGEETRHSVGWLDLNVGAQKYVGGVKEGELEPISIYFFLKKLWNEERVMWYTEKGHGNEEELREISDYIFDFISDRAIRINTTSPQIKSLLQNSLEKGDNY